MLTLKCIGVASMLSCRWSCAVVGGDIPRHIPQCQMVLFPHCLAYLDDSQPQEGTCRQLHTVGTASGLLVDAVVVGCKISRQ